MRVGEVVSRLAHNQKNPSANLGPATSAGVRDRLINGTVNRQIQRLPLNGQAKITLLTGSLLGAETVTPAALPGVA